MPSSSTVLPPPPPAGDIAPFSWLGALSTMLRVLAGTVVGAAAVLYWAGANLARALAWVLLGAYALAAWPLTRLLGLLRFLLSPVTYTVSYAAAPVFALFRFLGQFWPLYPYLGSAAFIGILAGLALAFASKYVVVVLQLHADKRDKASHENGGWHDGADNRTRPAAAWPIMAQKAPPRPVAAIKSEGGPEDVWLWLEEFNTRQPAAAATNPGNNNNNDSSATAALQKQKQTQKQRPGGLLSMTIMEESSSE
ncbi:hypothetical protein SPI_03261 [Niveomyces insectorum RCEF 264]|uniref:Uncharacterized protein n=1 Tax=Niveomyces insectorum RCEF 264 TaxID=1081102 RepID=A0A167X740_9HYPO|nr:hypothetical protein SPI_03261 [Niveomyces insectorum RCEF 264]